MSQIGILTPTQAAYDTPRLWIKRSEAQRLVSLKQIVMLTKKLGRQLVAKAAVSDSLRFLKSDVPVVRMLRLPVREWKQSLDLNYPEIGRESNARALRRSLWKRAYPIIQVSVSRSVNGAKDQSNGNCPTS